MAFPATDLSQVTAGEFVDENDWNALVDALNFLADPPACRVYHNASQSISANTETTVAFNSERFDTDSMHDTATNNSRITFNTAGLYVVTANIGWAAGTGSWTTYTNIRMDGATTIASQQNWTATGLGTAVNLTATYKFTAGQYVEVRVWQNSGTLGINSVNGYTPEFSAVWVGRG